MKTNKIHYPLIASAAIVFGAFLPMTFAGEKPVAQTKSLAVSSKSDPVVTMIGKKIIQPLNDQVNRRGIFSRRGPTQSIQYYLADTTGQDVTEERTFNVVQKVTHLGRDKKPIETEYLKLRYQKSTQSILVQLKESWVTPEEHPILKILPKPKKEVITP